MSVVQNIRINKFAIQLPTGLILGLVFIATLYVGLRLPLFLSDIPNWYHSYIESNTFEVAQSMATNGHPHEQPHPSLAGYNLHGILATPVFLLDLDTRLVRLVTLFAGAVSLFYVWKIQAIYDSSLRVKVSTAALLASTPHLVLLTGIAMPQSVTAMFGVIAIYYYLVWRVDGFKVRYAAISALFAGLGAFNHFSGLIIAATVGIFLLVELWSSRGWVRYRSPVLILTTIYLAANIPAILLWYSRRSRGLLELYEKYQLENSGELLFTSSWWRAQLHYMAEYQPIFLLIGSLALVMLASRYRPQLWQVPPILRNGILSPVYLWGIWFVVGHLQIVMFPRGSFIHEYYVWWAILPSAPLFVLMAQNVWKQRQALQVTAIVAVLLLSTVISAAQVSRAYGATDIPLLCRYQAC